MKKVLLFTVLITTFYLPFAQQLDFTHFLRYQSQYYTDPAKLPDSRVYITVPALGNVHFALQNSSFRYKNLFKTDAEGYPVVITPNKFVNSLAEKNNYFNFSLSEEIFGFGFRTKRLAIGFDYRIRVNMDLSYSRDLFGFFINGNMNYLGESNAAKMDMGLLVNAYNEISVSAAYHLKKFSFGIRPKLLLGLANVQTQKASAQIHTNPEDYSVYLKYNADILASYTIPSQWTIDLENMKFDFPMEGFRASQVMRDMMKNRGIGLDLGVRYTPIENLTVAASMLDFGYIRWNVNTYRMSSQIQDGGKYYDNGGFLFQGLTMDDVEDIRTGNFDTKGLADSLKTYFPLEKSKSSSYSFVLQPRYILQVDYDLLKSLRFSVVAQGHYLNHSFRPSFTLAVDKELFDIIDVCMAYTVSKKSYDNIALGLALRFGAIHVYLGTQSIMPVLDVTNLSKITLTAGMYLRFGKVEEEE